MESTRTRLFFVRHGETVDNVSRVYAGTKDSALTSHGVLQARRLADHLVDRARSIGGVTHLFSSDLRRAYQTAMAIRDAQKEAALVEPSLDVVEVPVLRERDFGSMEGKRGTLAKSSGRGFVPAETADAVAARAARFVQKTLIPLLESFRNSKERQIVVVVAHGVILSRMWPILLGLLREGLPHQASNSDSSRRAEPSFLANTGYHELVIDFATEPATEGAPLKDISLSILATNCTDHLVGLKKTKGGIGSTAFDPKQKTVDSFFAPKVD